MVRFGRLNVLKHASGGYMSEMVSPAEQVTRVATLLGRAVLRWKREKEQSSEISEIVSDSLPERLEFSPVSSLSVTGPNDEATPRARGFTTRKNGRRFAVRKATIHSA